MGIWRHENHIEHLPSIINSFNQHYMFLNDNIRSHRGRLISTKFSNQYRNEVFSKICNGRRYNGKIGRHLICFCCGRT
ncbi:unnamed protein product [Nezara viridula]|uniref:Uncharacterized protein n=1 Tax=Nezara viridula TaxID=85310 RepID=A0A9P0H304_NEZVI|nr:unnamed protein product [Nezara viridula]